MENEHVLSGLNRKRAEIAGELEAAQNRVRQFFIDIDNVDATIRIFQPDIDLDEIRPKPLPPRHAAFKGEISRAILSALRESGEALTVKDLTLRGNGSQKPEYGRSTDCADGTEAGRGKPAAYARSQQLEFAERVRKRLEVESGLTGQKQTICLGSPLSKQLQISGFHGTEFMDVCF